MDASVPSWGRNAANDSSSAISTDNPSVNPSTVPSSRISLARDQRATRITFEGAYNARPRVSPDGTQLAIVTLDQGAYRIAAVNLANGRSRVLSSGRLDEGPSFAPNGQTVLFAAREGGRGVLETVAIDGSVTSRISTTDGDVREAAWSPRITAR